jgi:hypothetical protein
MEMQDPTAIIARICPHEADDLDDLLVHFDSRGAGSASGADVFPEFHAVLMPDVRFGRSDAICIGLGLYCELADTPDHAVRLGSMALERDVEVVILSEVDLSGFERFGFRVERVAGGTAAARAACTDQIRRFWKLDLIL